MERATPRIANGVTFLVNFPMFWKMCLDMMRVGSGYEFNYEILVPGTDLRERSSITEKVDIALIPKAIGGDAVCIDTDGKEDETCTRGFHYPRLSAFLEGL